jgi:hypothetical protein
LFYVWSFVCHVQIRWLVIPIFLVNCPQCIVMSKSESSLAKKGGWFPQYYPPVVKHSNGKFPHLHSSMIFPWRPPFSSGISQPCLITGGYPHYIPITTPSKIIGVYDWNDAPASRIKTPSYHIKSPLNHNVC